MSDSYGNASVISSVGGTEIIANLTLRDTIIIKNNGSAIVYIGFDNTVTSSTGMPINPQGSIELIGRFSRRKISIYGIAASGTQDVRYLSWSS